MEMAAIGWLAGILTSVAVWSGLNPPLPHAGLLVPFPKTRQGVLSRLWSALIGPVIRFAARQWGKS